MLKFNKSLLANDSAASLVYKMMDPAFLSPSFTTKVYHGAGEMKRDVLRKDISR